MNTEATDLLPGTDPALEAPLEVLAPVELPELRFEYQPKDDSGRPVGGKQVIKYRTAEELGEKMAEQNKLLILKLRSETRRNRLGEVDTETLPDDAPRYEAPLTFEPIELTSEKRFALTRDLNDPEKFEEARDLLVESSLGAKPKAVRQLLTELQEDRLRARAKAESEAFVAENPDYVKCQENSDAITNWLIRYKLAPVRENFKEAYDKLKASGVLIVNYTDVTPEPQPAPVVIPTPPAPVADPVDPQPTALDPEPVILQPVAEPVVEAPKPTPPTRIPTGLSRNTSDDVGTPRIAGDDIVYEVVVGGQKRRYIGLAAISAMPADEYKRRTHADPNFSKKEAALEKEAAERRKNARR